jgi:sugar phosphate isomerase/epimerase
MNYKIGLKLWSINENYLEEAQRLFNKGLCQYIELYVVPGRTHEFLDMWTKLEVPYVIHAPHFEHGMNLASKECREYIIFHPGFSGEIKETLFQLKQLNDKRIVVENKPYYSLVNGIICNGYSVEDIGFILEHSVCGFCLDISHCICTANALHFDPFLYLRKFLKLSPAMFHLSDSHFNGTIDNHLHIGKGDYNFKSILNLLPKDAIVTLETPKNSLIDLSDFEEDVMALNSVFGALEHE